MRIKSGVPGLDELIDGGFPEGTVNLVCGPAGSAKSLLAMQYLCAGEKGVLITLEESRENALRASAGYGIKLADFEKEGRVTILDMGAARVASGIHNANSEDMADFSTLLEAALQLRKTSKAERLVVDSLSAVALNYQTDEEYRRDLFKFCRGLKASGLTSLLIAEATAGGATRSSAEPFIADSMILLGYENVKGEYRRTLTVYKMRFTRHDPYKHPFMIAPGGMEVDSEEVIF
ncbi:MAG: ATPase domain-containing protein [Methanobacteriota archaeon]